MYICIGFDVVTSMMVVQLNVVMRPLNMAILLLLSQMKKKNGWSATNSLDIRVAIATPMNGINRFFCLF